MRAPSPGERVHRGVVRRQHFFLDADALGVRQDGQPQSLDTAPQGGSGSAGVHANVWGSRGSGPLSAR